MVIWQQTVTPSVIDWTSQDVGTLFTLGMVAIVTVGLAIAVVMETRFKNNHGAKDGTFTPTPQQKVKSSKRVRIYTNGRFKRGRKSV